MNRPKGKKKTDKIMNKICAKEMVNYLKLSACKIKAKMVVINSLKYMLCYLNKRL